MVKRLHWTDMGMCLDVAPDDRPLYVTASDYDAAQARIRELEAQVRALRSAGYSCPTCDNDAVDFVTETKALGSPSSDSNEQ